MSMGGFIWPLRSVGVQAVVMERTKSFGRFRRSREDSQLAVPTRKSESEGSQRRQKSCVCTRNSRRNLSKLWRRLLERVSAQRSNAAFHSTRELVITSGELELDS